jgi:DNA-binding XRE family transcriptional regulator
MAARRKKLALSQEELANKLNVARQTVSSWERDVFLPDSKFLIAMCEIFGCSLDELVNPNPTRPLSTATTATEVGA